MLLINLMPPALGVFLVKVIYQKGQTDMITQTFGHFSPRIVKNFQIGELFFCKNLLCQLSRSNFLIAILVWFAIYKHVFGLYGYAFCGEHPQSGRYIGN